MTNLINNVHSLSDNGIDALFAIASNDEDYVFEDGAYTAEDVNAIAKAFEIKSGTRPSAYWLKGLRNTDNDWRVCH